MTIRIPEDNTSPSKSANELEYIEEQAPVAAATATNSNNPTWSQDTNANEPQSRVTQPSCHYCLSISCGLGIIVVLFRWRWVLRLLALSDENDVPSLQPLGPTGVPTSRPSPSPSIGFTNLPSFSSIPTLENGFRSIANEPGVIHLVQDGDCQSCASPEVEFPSPLKWSDEHQPVTSMAVQQGGSIKFYCGGAQANTFSWCPDLASIVQPKQYLADNSHRSNIYVLFESSQVDTTSDGQPFATISWESEVAYTSYNAQPSIYYDVNWEVKLYSGYVTVCYGPSRIEPRYIQETRLAFENSPPGGEVPNNWVYWYYPGPPFDERGYAASFPSNQCFSLGPSAP